MIYDCFTYNGEHDLFDIRYNILKDYVDEFIVIEFDKTFSGKDKKQLFNQFYEKVNYHFIKEEQYSKYKEMAEKSPNTKGASHWAREFMQKESIKDCLTHLRDDDLVFIGDVDEIPDTNNPYETVIGVIKLKLKVYTYYLNNRSSEEFWGTIVGHYKDIKNECLNHLRSTKAEKTDMECGWHFTSLKDDLARKLTDSYTAETYANDSVMDNLAENIENNRDFLGRDFTYRIDELDLPEYLCYNREKYVAYFK